MDIFGALRKCGALFLWYTTFVGASIFYTAVAAFSVGIFISSFVPIGFAEAGALGVVSLGLAAIYARNRNVDLSVYVLYGALFVGCGALGMLRMEYAEMQEVTPFFEDQVGQEVVMEGVVRREPDERESTTHLYVEVEDEMVLVVTSRYAEVFYGDRIRFSGELSKPESFETDLGRTFNYPGYLHARGVSYTVWYAHAEVLATDQGNPLFARLLAFKYAFMEQIESLIPEPQSGLAEGLLLGVKRALGEDLESAFRTTGIIHIVVLSGYNVMLVVAFVLYMLSFVLPLRGRLLFGLCAITAFAFMVGLSATVVRASIMAALILIARTFGRTYEVVRALFITGVVMLLFNPYLLVFDTGFQLSFVATFGLIMLAPVIERAVTFMPKSLGLREFLTATLATQIFVTPILLYQIGEFSVVAVLVNLLVLPMVPVAMLLTFIMGMLGFISATLALPFAFFAHVSLTYILRIAEFFAQLPFASYVVPPFPFVAVVLAYVALGYGLYRMHCSLYARDSDPNPLRGWTIVEEHTLIQNDSSTKDESLDTPVFFR